jgi:type I restriction-modification system DNA methylase subunit
MVECIAPEPMKTIADPACGTGGFFLAAYDYLVDHNKLDKAQSKFLKYNTFFGNEIVSSTRRLALMNLFLHNIGDIDSDNFISPADALIAQSPDKYDYILANPPFGKRAAKPLPMKKVSRRKRTSLTTVRTSGLLPPISNLTLCSISARCLKPQVLRQSLFQIMCCLKVVLEKPCVRNY